MTPELPRPSRAEEMALFRHSVLGDLLARPLERGELQEELKARAARRYRPPGARASRQYHWKTLQNWVLCGACDGAAYLIATGAADLIGPRAADVTGVRAADLIHLRAADLTAVGAADLIA